MPDTLIAITTSQAMIICLVLIGYQRRHMANEYGAREALRQRND